MHESIKDVKVGDKIKCVNAYLRNEYDIFTVDRVTKTLAVCGSVSFQLESGLMRGTRDRFRSRYGYKTTDAEVAEIKAGQDLKARLRAAKARLECFRVTADNLEAVEALLKAGK
jgi:hypothetical protein